MDRTITLPSYTKRSDTAPCSKSKDGPKWHFCMLAGLILILCMGAMLETWSAQLIGLSAFVCLILCHFMDTVGIKRSDRRLRAIFEASPNPIVVYNRQGHPQRLNPAFTQVFGWTLDELRGKCIPFVPEAEKPITMLKIREIFQTGRPVSFETRRMTKTGEIRDVIISAAIAMGRDNTPREMVVNITDITDRNRFEAQLQQAHKMGAMGTLAGGIAHDFNNLLSPLIGYSEMLMDDLPPDSPLQEKAAEILTAGRRAKELVNQILTFSRQSDAKPEAIKLQPFITETLKLIRVSIPSNIIIQQEIDADCGPVMANSTQVHQVLMNLTTNAYHAMEETGGQLRVTLEQAYMKEDSARSAGLRPGRYAHLIVSDTGIGIATPNLSKIFDPYFTTKAKSKGTGLGLSVARGIIERVGGNIKAFSKAGAGSEFHVYWPLARHGNGLEKDPSPEPVPCGTEKILLVDDETSVLKMVRLMLERLGYHVAAFTSGAKALAAFEEDPESFDLVLTDMTMPEMTGDFLARKVVAVHPTTPVLVSTGYSNTLTPEIVREVGIKGVLAKPVSKINLASAIRKALDDAKPFTPQPGKKIRVCESSYVQDLAVNA